MRKDGQVDGAPGTATLDRGVFPIVAIGASAGGLAPTIEVLRFVGAQPGIAIVVIHHLDPTHASNLVDILSRVTTMSVVVAGDGALVQPNHVYVVPPNAGLLITQGILRVMPRIEERGLHLPIDRFFESLALDRGVLAVGVVLTGTGFDGTAGVKAIKREGGITLAQDATAPYRNMPENAIATGCVDFVFPPEGIARELAHIGEHPPQPLVIPSDPVARPEYLQILAAVRRASGVDFASYKQSTIGRRLQRRLFLRRVGSLAEYVELLKSDPAEVDALCEDVLIHVTGFFRDPEGFEMLKTSVFPKLFEDRPRDAPIRIWVPGCSTGEETYSIAICLTEYLEETHRADVAVRIFGTDLSLATVERARVGTYLESIEGDVSPERLRRFFSKDGGVYQIRRDVREMCVFAKHDVTRDPPFSGMDLISCRNVMIYLGPELQNRVVALLHYALKEPGFLVLGTSETIRSFPGFSPIDGKNKIYARTSAAPRQLFDFTTPRLELDPLGLGHGGAAGLERSIGARPSSANDVHREADRLLLAELAPPGVIVTHDLAIVQFRGQTGPFLEHAPGVANLDLLRMAHEELRLPLRRLTDEARSKQVSVLETGLPFGAGPTRRTITLRVIPFAVRSTQQHFFLVLFEALSPEAPQAPTDESAPTTAGTNETPLTQQLASTRRYLESVIEQLEGSNEELRAANEEIVSSNEELRSANEELQSAKEELQATNEELSTVNDEMRDRNVEATRLSDDLKNVLNSVEIPIILLGRDSRVRRFTPAAAAVFGLVATDLGRPVGDLASIIAVAPSLTELIADALARLRSADCVAQDRGGHWYQLSVRPYVTLDGRIDGTVITALDVDTARKGAEHLAAAQKYAESIVDTVREGLVVLGRDLRVHSANKAFLRMFGLTAQGIEGRHLDELEGTALPAPSLKKLVNELQDGNAVEGLRMDADDASGRRVLTLNARHIEGTPLVLLAVDDITETVRAAEAVEAARNTTSSS